MDVPSRVKERIIRLETQELLAEKRKKADVDYMTARMNVMADLNRRRDRLLACSLEIFAWRRAVVESNEGKRLWALLGGIRVPLYLSWYWNGLKVEPNNELCVHTRVSLDGPSHQFLVEEWMNDALYGEVVRPSSPISLLDYLHPDFIVELHEYLTGPDCWQQIATELDRRLARHLTQ
jgi:hypothetical protein